jgi:hypothetical protein
VAQTAVDHALKTLSEKYGPNFQLRDQKLPGRKNVTVTQYAVPITFKGPNGNTLSSKIRFRKYYDAAEATPLSKAKLHPADIVKDRQFVEFKIDHPEYQQVVIVLFFKSGTEFADLVSHNRKGNDEWYSQRKRKEFFHLSKKQTSCIKLRQTLKVA